MKFRHDHSFCIIRSEEVYLRFKELGFQINPDEVVIHPNNLKCRFLMFENGYLEFIEGPEDIREDPERQKPGFSLIAEGSLRKLYEEVKEDFKNFQISLDHRNYNWKENSIDILPGWNFLNFNDDFLPGIQTWVTEYEEKQKSEKISASNKEKKQDNARVTDHLNGCRKIIGAYWVFPKADDMVPLCDLLQKYPDSGKIALDKDFELFVEINKDSGSGGDSGIRACFSPYRAVILGCEDLSRFKEISGIKDEMRFMGKRAVRIELDAPSWDMIITEITE